ncbi:hypothetical protein LTR12_005786 [Friedmanniomyces endolithicus]|nr:hypothetical protein LTR74_000837 [Friedmanniomyces endolithicus]KAK1819760.1 hypothetical protein LTR12_005786 [Friedmanniomyces endolithicus]
MASMVDPRCAYGAESLVVGDTVEVVVGADEDVFYIHERLLRSRSTFFEAALYDAWERSQRIELLDDHPDVFNEYALWLYTGKLAVIMSNGSTDFDFLAGLFGFGEKIVDDTFQDCVIDAFVAGTRTPSPNGAGVPTRCCPPYTTVDIVYKATPKGSPARRLMVELYTLKAGDDSINIEHPEKNNHEFLVDLASSLLKNRSVCQDFEDKHKELNNGTPCSYHKHSEEETCTGSTP